MPTPQPKRAEPVTIEQLRAFALEIAKINDAVESALSLLETRQEDSIAAYNYRSGVAGLQRLKAFSDALAKSVFRVRTGTPLQVGEHKPRYKAGDKDKEQPNPTSKRRKKSTD